MQKLRKRNTYTPTDAPQVRGNCGLQLNKEETLSVASLKTSLNNPEVDLSQHTAKRKVVVYVVSIDGNGLMPCTPAKAKNLMNKGLAEVYKMYPFTIKLKFECENVVQNVDLGIDEGYSNIGFSAVSHSKELISGTVILENKTSDRLREKKMYRNGRRSKKWYRKPRFLNRKKRTGMLRPSVERKYQAHLKIIRLCQEILPISSVILESGNFDIQKINNPEIVGEGYQKGDMYGYQNIRSYLMSRENGKCQLCNKEFSKGQPSHIHHILERSKKGSDMPKNLAILHKKCHVKLHKKGLKLSAPKTMKAETFMSTIAKRFYLDLPDFKETFGYITFVKRNELGLEKTHFNDAFAIANGTNQERISPIVIRQKRRNNRALQLNRKGFKPSIRKQRYKIQPKDLVWIGGVKHYAIGIQHKGNRVVVEKDKKSYAIKKVEKIYNFGTFAFY
jgi:hypothetical protein